MDPISITALVVSCGTAIAYLIKKLVNKSSCTGKIEVDLTSQSKKSIHDDVRQAKHDLANELHSGLGNLQLQILSIESMVKNIKPTDQGNSEDILQEK